MAKEIQIRGTIYDNDSADIMRYFGWYDNVCPMDISDALEKAEGDDIDLIINSEGGVLTAGLEIYCMLKKYRGNVTAYIQSFSA